MRCTICDTMLQLHSRSDICSTCHSAILEARLWFVDDYEYDLPTLNKNSEENEQ